MKYFKPKSTAWWSGVALIAYGLLTQEWDKVMEGAAIVGIRGAL